MTVDELRSILDKFPQHEQVFIAGGEGYEWSFFESVSVTRDEHGVWINGVDSPGVES